MRELSGGCGTFDLDQGGEGRKGGVDYLDDVIGYTHRIPLSCTSKRGDHGMLL